MTDLLSRRAAVVAGVLRQKQANDWTCDEAVKAGM